MMSKTHSAFGVALVAVTLVVLGEPMAPLALVAGGVGGLLPDIDHPASKISTGNIILRVVGIAYRLALRVVAWLLGCIALLLRRVGIRVPVTTAGHRGPLTHSPFSVLIFAALLVPVAMLDWTIYLAMLIGVLSHVIIDTLNPGGTPLLYPLTARKFSALPRFIAPVTGSGGETVVRVAVYALIAVAVLASFRTGVAFNLNIGDVFGSGPIRL